MFKKILSIVAFLFIIPATLLSQQNLQDVVYLKDGSIISGTIIEQIPNVSLKIQTRDGNVFVYSMDRIMKITKEPARGSYKKEGSYKQEGVNEKSPGLAFALSFLIPGVGQYYNGEVTKGVIQESIYVTGWVLFFTLGTETVEYSEYDYYWEGYNYYTEEQTTAWLYIGLGMATGAYLWSIIDAPLSATEINKRNEQNYGHLFEFNQGKNVLGFDFGPTKKGMGASLSYHF